MIKLETFSFRYPGEEKDALRGINIKIPKGQFCGLIGPNGAGKSSLCYAISGMIPHYFKGKLTGSAEVSGLNIPSTPLGELIGRVGLVFQNPFNQISGSRFSVRGEVALGLENLAVPRGEINARVERALGQAGLQELADRSPYALSGGQQQRLAIASILVMRPDVLILDEPTSQLDPLGTRDVFTLLDDLVAQEETTILIASHKVELLAEASDRVLVLDHGELIADGQPGSILTDPILEKIGVQPTRFTQAARDARDRGLIRSDRTLPVTLAQAKEFFNDAAV